MRAEARTGSSAWLASRGSNLLTKSNGGTRFPSILRVGIHILALLAVLIQCSPLRTCAFQALLGGTSCHDEEGSVADDAKLAMAADGCVPHPASGHDEQCLCERPRTLATLSANPLVSAPELVSPLESALVIDHTDLFTHGANAIAFESPPASVGRCLPLLI
jgi:hypothetical protein